MPSKEARFGGFLLGEAASTLDAAAVAAALVCHLSVKEHLVSKNDNDQRVWQSSLMTHPFATDPTSTLYLFRCNRFSLDTSFSTSSSL
jgi:hypothetical protein